MLDKLDEPRPDPRYLDELVKAGADLFPLTDHRDESIELRARGKRPWRKGWRDTRPLAREQAIAHMVAGRNIGERLKPDDLVIDIDPRHFNDGQDYSDPETACKAALSELEDWCAKHGFDCTGWPLYVTGSGGIHVRLKKPADMEAVTKIEGRPGFEFKTAGTFIVTPGSVHARTGCLYEPWFLNLVDLNDAPDAPAALLDLLHRPQIAEPIGGGELEPEELGELLGVLEPTAYREHSRWFGLMAASHHATNGAGEEVFLTWSAQDPLFADDVEVNRARWQSLSTDKPRVATVATLFRAVHDVGRGDLIPVHAIQAKDEFDDEVDPEWLDRGKEGASEDKPHRWKLWEVEELGQLPSIEWLAQGMMPERGLGQIYGPTKSHKTFLSLALSLSIAAGRDFCGVPTKRGRVVYVIGEGQSDVYDRVLAWCLANDVKLEDIRGWFRLVISPVLLDGEEVEAFIQLTADDGPFDLAVFDTVNRCMQGDENDTRSMTQFVKGCDHIRETFGCAVIVVHHTGWGGQRARGSSVLLAAVDVSMQVKLIDEDQSRDTRLLVEHIRAAAPGKQLFFAPHTVVTGGEGDELRSSIVLHQIDEPETVSSKDVRKMNREVAKGELLLEIAQKQPKQQRELVRNQPYRSQATVSAFVKELRDDGLLQLTLLVLTEEGLEHVRDSAPDLAERLEAEQAVTEEEA